jgi:hypothetical protein
LRDRNHKKDANQHSGLWRGRKIESSYKSGKVPAAIVLIYACFVPFCDVNNGVILVRILAVLYSSRDITMMLEACYILFRVR